MAKSKPVALCTQLMLSGKLCRRIALKDQRYCRAHIRNHRLAERQLAELAALDCFAGQVEVMNISELLNALHRRLENFYLAYNIISRFPELRYLLVETMERLGELNSQESNADPQLALDQMLPYLGQMDLNQLNRRLALSVESDS